MTGAGQGADNDALKPCPFCGETAFRSMGDSYVSCSECGAMGPDSTDDDGIVTLWNRREQDAALLREVEGLKAALRKYGWHDIKLCAATNTNGARFTDMECTCGFDAALSPASGGV